MFMNVHGGQRAALGVIRHHPPHEAVSLIRVVDGWSPSPVDLPFCVSECWGYENMPPRLALSHGFCGFNSGPRVFVPSALPIKFLLIFHPPGKF